MIKFAEDVQKVIETAQTFAVALMVDEKSGVVWFNYSLADGES
jgi:hypothetical protein